jgi:plasmid stabilization system protein ParE
MAFKVIWSPKAVETFDKVIDYLHKNWTEKEIKKFVRETEHVIHLVSINPHLFRASEKENIFEAIITKHNLLLYQVNQQSKTIELLSFFDTHQDPKKK